MSSSSLVSICAREAKSSRTFCSQRTSCFDWGSWKHCCQYIKRKKNYNELLRRNINSKIVYLALNSSSPQFHFLVLKPLAVSPRFHGRDVPPQSSHGLKQYWNSFDYHINIILIINTNNNFLFKSSFDQDLKSPLYIHTHTHTSKMQQNPTWLLLHKIWAMTKNTHVLNYVQFPKRRLLFFNPLKVFIHV